MADLPIGDRGDFFLYELIENPLIYVGVSGCDVGCGAVGMEHTYDILQGLLIAEAATRSGYRGLRD